MSPNWASTACFATTAFVIKTFHLLQEIAPIRHVSEIRTVPSML
jgi:hypothetical protein